jgi:hypothetical protein
MVRAPLFAIVTAAGADAVRETLRLVPHLEVGRWLVDQVAGVTVTLRGQAPG